MPVRRRGHILRVLTVVLTRLPTCDTLAARDHRIDNNVRPSLQFGFFPRLNDLGDPFVKKAHRQPFLKLPLLLLPLEVEHLAPTYAGDQGLQENMPLRNRINSSLPSHKSERLDKSKLLCDHLLHVQPSNS